MAICIAVPSAGGFVSHVMMQSVHTLTRDLAQLGHDSEFLNTDGADVVAARNRLMNHFLIHTSCSHMLWIDADMHIPRGLAGRLLRAEKPMVGALYTRREMNQRVYVELLQQGRSERLARAAASEFVFKLAPGAKDLTVEGDLLDVAGIGFGCVLMERSVPEAMVRGAVVEPLQGSTLIGAHFDAAVYDFFSLVYEEARGDWLSEDFSFCHRYRRLPGAKVHAVPDIAVGHVGSQVHATRFTDRLEALSLLNTQTFRSGPR
jgi:hypothetical protein